jgi:hypothetical protein
MKEKINSKQPPLQTCIKSYHRNKSESIKPKHNSESEENQDYRNPLKICSVRRIKMFKMQLIPI